MNGTSWDKRSINGTFRTCVNALNSAKGCGIEFVEAKIRRDNLEAVIRAESDGTHYYYMQFWFEDLAKAVGKADQGVNFGQLTDKQHLKLCQHIVKELWGIAKML